MGLMKLRRKYSGRMPSFTLIELLITVIIVGVLAGLGVSYYINVMAKSRASKARHALALIAEAEKMYRIDYGVYCAVAADAVEVTIGTTVTGMNLAAVDNDTDFTYSVTVGVGNNIISANNPAVIGTCPVNTPIAYNLDTGAISVPGCYR